MKRKRSLSCSDVPYGAEASVREAECATVPFTWDAHPLTSSLDCVSMAMVYDEEGWLPLFPKDESRRQRRARGCAKVKRRRRARASAGG